MEKLEKRKILDSFTLHIDNINFLIGEDDAKTEITSDINILKDDTKSAADHLKCGKNLWKLLLRKSIYKLYTDLSGFNILANYIDYYTGFEELLFGLEPFYRDHSLHSLWVYFLGEYFLKNNYVNPKDIQVSIEMYENFKTDKKVQEISNHSRESVLKNLDELWCITALTHDLGYPISKIETINKKINDILPYFGKFIKQEFSLEKSVIQSELFLKMLHLISSDIHYTKENLPNQILKIDRYLPLVQSVESYDHGVLSAYLIYKNLFPMTRTPFYETGSSVVHDKEEVKIFLTNQAILKSMALHSCKFKRFTKFPSFESLLVVADELEEFSRWSRSGKQRNFITDICEVYCDITNEKIQMVYVFSNERLNIDPEDFFKNKCPVFMNIFDLKLFNLPEAGTEIEPPNITITVKDERKTLYKNYIFNIENNKWELNIITFKPEGRDEVKQDNREYIEGYFNVI